MTRRNDDDNEMGDMEDIDDEMENMEDMEDMGDMEMPNLFWHVQLTPDAETELEPPVIDGFVIHVTKASFGANVKQGSRTVIVTKDENKNEIPVCVLLEGKNESESLNLIISDGLTFQLKGKNVSPVSLTGFIAPPPRDHDGEDALSMDENMEDMDDIEDVDELPPDLKEAMIKKRKLRQAQKDDDEEQKDQVEPPNKKAKIANKTETEENKADNNEKPLTKAQKKKQKQAAKKAAAVNNNGNNNDNEEKEDNKPTQSPKEPTKNVTTNASPKNVAAPSPKDAPKNDMEKMKNGIQYKELRNGDGPAVQPGQKLAVYYVGQLKDKSIFDKSISGEGFEFTLGKGEVIKGWDEGIKGMKVGGKRRIVVPAHLAYGKVGTDNIPPNSELTFTVEIRKIAD